MKPSTLADFYNPALLQALIQLIYPDIYIALSDIVAIGFQSVLCTATVNTSAKDTHSGQPRIITMGQLPSQSFMAPAALIYHHNMLPFGPWAFLMNVSFSHHCEHCV